MGAGRFSLPRPAGWRRRGFTVPSVQLPGAKTLLRRSPIALAVLLVLAAGYFLWLRDSSLVAVERVTVTGAEGEPAVEAALAQAGMEMSTLNVDEDALRLAVADLPSVLSVDASPDFPRGLAIDVEVRRPVAYLEDEGGTILAGDGVVLETGAERPAGLPLLEAEPPMPDQPRAEGETLTLARVLAAAPAVLLPEVDEATVHEERGPVVTVGAGIELRFGDPSRAEAKWAAAAAVLSDPELDAATYIDLSVPARPVVG